MSRRLILASLLAAGAPAVLAAGAPVATTSDPADYAAFQAAHASANLIFKSQVEIDGQGRIVKVTPEEGTPAEFQPAITAAVQALQFAPTMQAGHAVAGSTFVWMKGCPVDGAPGAAPQFRYSGHGPEWLTPRPPAFPRQAAISGAEGYLKVQLRVLPDGSAEYIDVQALQGGVRAVKAFRPAIKAWAEQQRFVPERLDGQPQAGTREVPVMFNLGSIKPPPQEPDPCQAPADQQTSRSLFRLATQP